MRRRPKGAKRKLKPEGVELFVRFKGDETDTLARRDLHLVRRAGRHKKVVAGPHGRGGTALDGGAAFFARGVILSVHLGAASD